MKYAKTGTIRFEDDDGDYIVLKEEPSGAQYDQRVKLLGSMKISTAQIDSSTSMKDLFSGNEALEIAMDKAAIAEFQFKALFVEMGIGGRVFDKVADAIHEYRLLSRESKNWVDEAVDSIWKRHDEDVESIVRAEGESGSSSKQSSEAGLRVVEGSDDTNA